MSQKKDSQTVLIEGLTDC